MDGIFEQIKNMIAKSKKIYDTMNRIQETWINKSNISRFLLIYMISNIELILVNPAYQILYPQWAWEIQWVVVWLLRAYE